VIDMLNPYTHEDADPLMASVRRVIPSLRALIDGAREAGMLTVYVNDNHGDWSSGRPELVRRALAGNAPELVEPVIPPEDDPFHPDLAEAALRMMETNMHAQLTASAEQAVGAATSRR
jgi:nicotinamidase-related amidase